MKIFSKKIIVIININYYIKFNLIILIIIIIFLKKFNLIVLYNYLFIMWGYYERMTCNDASAFNYRIKYLYIKL